MHGPAKWPQVVSGAAVRSVNDEIAGGVGCSSGTPDQDEVVAQAGIDAFLKSLGVIYE